MTLMKTPRAPLKASPEEEKLNHFKKLTTLLERESASQAALLTAKLSQKSPSEAEKAGLSIVGLRIEEISYGLAGRALLSLKKNSSLPLPWTTLGPGSPVIIRPQSAKNETIGWRGITLGLKAATLEIALEFLPEELDEEDIFRIDLCPDEITRLRQEEVLTKAQKASPQSRDPKEARLAVLTDVLLGLREPTFLHPQTLQGQKAPLNASQMEAIAHALAAEDVGIIHGPPGTGKTTTLAALIHIAVENGEKILVSAASNLAVDNVLEKLLKSGIRAIRIGHPARVLEDLRAHTLDYLVMEHEDFRLAAKFRKEAQKLFQEVRRFKRARPEPGAKDAARREARDLMREAKRLEQQAVDRILDKAQVISITASAIDKKVLGERYFDRIVIDEAGQATEPTSWLPVPWGSRLVLAGDHMQLPPTVTSQEALSGGLGISLMERLVTQYGGKITRTLKEQYRMHRDIMGFSAAEFYGQELFPHPSVASHLLGDLLDSPAHDVLSRPLQFFDTAGANFDEKQDADDQSRYNPQEGKVVMKLVQEYLTLGLSPQHIGIIAPYAAQVKYLRKLFETGPQGLEIESIDGFQGREKELMIISLVRSNSEGDIGFLKEWRRLNVAFTRARRSLVIIGDSATLSHHDFFQRWLDYVGSIDAHRTVWEREDFIS